MLKKMLKTRLPSWIVDKQICLKRYLELGHNLHFSYVHIKLSRVMEGNLSKNGVYSLLLMIASELW